MMSFSLSIPEHLSFSFSSLFFVFVFFFTRAFQIHVGFSLTDKINICPVQFLTEGVEAPAAPDAAVTKPPLVFRRLGRSILKERTSLVTGTSGLRCHAAPHSPGQAVLPTGQRSGSRAEAGGHLQPGRDVSSSTRGVDHENITVPPSPCGCQAILDPRCHIRRPNPAVEQSWCSRVLCTSVRAQRSLIKR